ncbi:conserved protein of unknown function [Clostridium beijerinckii]|nr:conserved protein of unknown function [Clostridium beijerinckii]
MACHPTSNTGRLTPVLSTILLITGVTIGVNEFNISEKPCKATPAYIAERNDFLVDILKTFAITNIINGTIIADPNVSIIDLRNANIFNSPIIEIFYYLFSSSTVLNTSSKNLSSPIPVRHANALIVGIL